MLSPARCQVGIWIDDNHAVLVWLSGGAESVECLESGLFAKPQRVAPPHESHQRPAGTSRAADEHCQRAAYYGKVVKRLQSAAGIYLIGPGRAKNELYQELVRHGLSGLIAAVETADQLTLTEIAVRLRKLFRPRERPVNADWRRAATEAPHPEPTHPEQAPDRGSWAPLI
jgi:hypothetical protein